MTIDYNKDGNQEEPECRTCPHWGSGYAGELEDYMICHNGSLRTSGRLRITHLLRDGVKAPNFCPRRLKNSGCTCSKCPQCILLKRIREGSMNLALSKPKLTIPAPGFRIGDEVRSCYQSPVEHPHLLEPGPAPKITGRAFRLAPLSDYPNDLRRAVYYGYWIYQLGKCDSCYGSYSYREAELYPWSEDDREEWKRKND